LFLVLLVLGLGWAANQEWGWPLPALFDRDGESDGQQTTPEVVAEQPAGEQPEVEEPSVEAVAGGTDPEQQAAPPADVQAEAEPAATDPAVPPEQDLAEETASGQQGAQQPGPTAEPPAEPEPMADTEATSEPADQTPGQGQAGTHASTGSTGGDAVTGVLPTDAPPASTEAPIRPSFDIVRVKRDGHAVIAGRAAPGAEVEVRSGGQVIDRVRASRRGEWVAIPAKPLAPGDQELSAAATEEGAAPVESDQVVVVAVPRPTSPGAAAAETSAQPVAVLLPRDGGGQGRILQAPGRLSADGTLALMTVSYDESGEVLLSGEAPPGVPVRIYVDNRPAALVVGDAKGAWSSGLGEALAPGTYTLRLDQLGADGQTVARIETPFTRVSEPPVEGNIQVDYVVVQPGNSLWRIARRLYGKGLDYVHIYGANQGQIRNPDLIYPGQVFEIPESGSAG
jgi:nucleoid-associated protein YgaU